MSHDCQECNKVYTRFWCSLSTKERVELTSLNQQQFLRKLRANHIRTCNCKTCHQRRKFFDEQADLLLELCNHLERRSDKVIVSDLVLFTPSGIQESEELQNKRQRNKETAKPRERTPTASPELTQQEHITAAVKQKKAAQVTTDKAKIKELLFSKTEEADTTPQSTQPATPSSEPFNENEDHRQSDQLLFGRNLFLKNNTIYVAQALLHDNFLEYLAKRRNICRNSRELTSHCKHCLCRLEFEISVAEAMIQNVIQKYDMMQLQQKADKTAQRLLQELETQAKQKGKPSKKQQNQDKAAMSTATTPAPTIEKKSPKLKQAAPKVTPVVAIPVVQVEEHSDDWVSVGKAGKPTKPAKPNTPPEPAPPKPEPAPPKTTPTPKPQPSINSFPKVVTVQASAPKSPSVAPWAPQNKPLREPPKLIDAITETAEVESVEYHAQQLERAIRGASEETLPLLCTIIHYLSSQALLKLRNASSPHPTMSNEPLLGNVSRWYADCDAGVSTFYLQSSTGPECGEPCWEPACSNTCATGTRFHEIVDDRHLCSEHTTNSIFGQSSEADDDDDDSAYQFTHPAFKFGLDLDVNDQQLW